MAFILKSNGCFDFTSSDIYGDDMLALKDIA